eukprot:12470249-Ditylum_brightwellii.AAC.1
MEPISKGKQGGVVSSILVPDKLNIISMYDKVMTGLRFQPVWEPMNYDDQVMARLLALNTSHWS